MIVKKRYKNENEKIMKKRERYNNDNDCKQELTAEAESKPFDEARNTVMATAPYRK